MLLFCRLSLIMVVHAILSILKSIAIKQCCGFDGFYTPIDISFIPAVISGFDNDL